MDHVLQEPLVVRSGVAGATPGVLPPGTRLQYDKTFPEGFDRYHVFVNVQGSDWELEETNPPTLVDPLSAFTASGSSQVAPEAVKRLLKGLGVDRDTLERVLADY